MRAGGLTSGRLQSGANTLSRQTDQVERVSAEHDLRGQERPVGRAQNKYVVHCRIWLIELEGLDV